MFRQTERALVEMPALASAPRPGGPSSFRAIAVDTLGLVNKGNLPGAVARIRDLETSWDDAEPSPKPRTSADWQRVDSAINRALSALRAEQLKQAVCRLAPTNLLRIVRSTSFQSIMPALECPGPAAVKELSTVLL
jgi:hypothetical protein